eukprot:SAG11_NODE_3633_length_2322_cov_22.753036_2_plen_251_part_00
MRTDPFQPAAGLKLRHTLEFLPQLEQPPLLLSRAALVARGRRGGRARACTLEHSTARAGIERKPCNAPQPYRTVRRDALRWAWAIGITVSSAGRTDGSLSKPLGGIEPYSARHSSTSCTAACVTQEFDAAKPVGGEAAGGLRERWQPAAAAGPRKAAGPQGRATHKAVERELAKQVGGVYLRHVGGAPARCSSAARRATTPATWAAQPATQAQAGVAGAGARRTCGTGGALASTRCGRRAAAASLRAGGL